MRPAPVDFDFAPGGRVRLELDSWGVERGLGAHRLEFRYRVERAGVPTPGVVVFFFGAVHLVEGWGWIGDLHADQALPLAKDNQPRTVNLSTTISNEQLAAIEERRRGRDLALRVDLTVVLAGAEDLDYPNRTHQDQIHIPAAERAARAEQLGALVTVPVLVPLPLGDPDSQRAKAGGNLREALRAIADGRHRDAVSGCRDALELLDSIDPQAGDPAGKARDRTLEQRFAALRTALKSVANGPTTRTL